MLYVFEVPDYDLNFLKTKNIFNFTYKFTSYRTVNTCRLGYNTDKLMTDREIIAICSDICKNTRCGQNEELLDVKPGGTYSNHWILNELLLSEYREICAN